MSVGMKPCFVRKKLHGVSCIIMNLLQEQLQKLILLAESHCCKEVRSMANI